MTIGLKPKASVLIEGMVDVACSTNLIVSAMPENNNNQFAGLEYCDNSSINFGINCFNNTAQAISCMIAEITMIPYTQLGMGSHNADKK